MIINLLYPFPKNVISGTAAIVLVGSTYFRMLLRITTILLVWTTLVVSERVYVHPFYLLTYNQSSCDELNKVKEETSEEQTFTPVPIQAKTSPLDEMTLKDQLVSFGQTLDSEDKMRSTEVGLLLNLVGFRMYKMLREMMTPVNGALLLSPFGLFGTLSSFYLGSVDPTASNLQTFLGVSSQDKSCTSKLDGNKVLSALKAVQSLLLAQEKKGSSSLLLTTVVGLFTSPDLRLQLSFVQGLSPFANAVYSRSLNLATDPELAAKKIDMFVGAVTGWTKKTRLTGIGLDTTLLFTTYTHFQGAIKGISLLAEPQVFWINNTTSIFVPMLSGTGIFQYGNDISNNFSVIQIPFNENAFILLIKPQDADLEKIEDFILSQDFSSWKKHLSPRKIHLTLPKLVQESTYDLQKLLTYTKLPKLLGEEAKLSKISSANLKVGKVMNTVLFELKESQEEQEKQSQGVSLEVKLDSPFFFAIYEKVSKAYLFLSRVTNPLTGV
ncbi:angiotensinogen isoform X1 [Antechinus flavipes]|uniref:angiotensinogen isoform X1 n=2 Tax=Antechinus flavipes TaxID=38775 RepID=UPI00223675FB|nr:angiotensinogen isoform X1 [Antechinus flavipes]